MLSPVLLGDFMGLGTSTITGFMAFFTTEATFVWLFAIGGQMTFFAALKIRNRADLDNKVWILKVYIF